MFDRFSDHNKRLMGQARVQALQLGHEFIAPEHMFLGLLEVRTSTACHVLAGMVADLDVLRAATLAALQPKAPVEHGQLPFTPRAKKVLETSLEEAARRGDHHIGTEHVLTALAVVGDAIPAKVLAAHGIDAAKLRAALSTLVSPTRDRVRALLISNSTAHGGAYLAHCAAEIRAFLGEKQRVLFVPYALADHAAYAAKARAAFQELGHDIVSAHEVADPAFLLTHCTAAFVGGGNTFRLLKALHTHRLFDALRTRALAGMPYVGSSAGTNVATLSIRTTNDMPIVMPPSLGALGLVPFQINPHYLDPDPTSKHMGETREERIRQFHEEDDVPVLGLREGCMLRVEGNRMELRGSTAARLFRRGQAPVEHTPPCDLSFLLAAAATAS
jgi:dipeptidase E